MTKHEAMVAYIGPKVQELIGGSLGFNFADGGAGKAAFVTNYSDQVRKRYIRVGEEKEYTFTLLLNQYFSSNLDELNLQAMNLTQQFIEWVDRKEALKEYPDFGPKCRIKKLENLQNMPNLAAVDWENHVAQYALQCRVVYFESKKGTEP